MASFLSSYKALVLSTNLSSSLTQKLLIQLHYSPLCKEIVLSSSAQSSTDQTSISPKIHQITPDSLPAASQNTSLAFALDPASVANLITNIQSPIPHVSVVLPIFSKFSEQSLNSQRLSLFRPAFVYDASELGPDRRLFDCERMKAASYAVFSQFLPSKYREVSADDLALALRLNAELCASEGRVEELGRTEIFQVIGKDL